MGKGEEREDEVVGGVGVRERRRARGEGVGIEEELKKGDCGQN